VHQDVAESVFFAEIIDFSELLENWVKYIFVQNSIFTYFRPTPLTVISEFITGSGV
jgi:hypothetical protein